MSASFKEVKDFAAERLTEALAAANSIHFAEMSLSEQYSKRIGSRLLSKASSIDSDPEYSAIDTTYGSSAWAVILNVDLRSSTWIAEKHGAKNMYLTMHTYLPTMIELVCCFEGTIVGLRGDGLIAAFGVTKRDGAQQTVTEHVSDKAVKSASSCAKAMIEAVEEIVNPLFTKNKMYGSLSIGVGIDVGDIVITRIGLRDATELTAYGNPVNRCCKLNDKNVVNEVVISNQAHEIFPTSKGGKMKFHPKPGGFTVEYPSGTNYLERTDNPISTARPR